jgi:hypothetical protein
VALRDPPERGTLAATARANTEHRTRTAAKGRVVTAAEFENLTAFEAECLLRNRLKAFIDAGAAPCGALLLAAQLDVPEQAAVQLLRQGLCADLTLRLLA